MKFRTLLLGFSALLVAGCAAYFSVSGLSKLFAGATISVIIMAGSLEFAKLVSAGFVYNYWPKLNSLLKGYLTFAIVILMLITSAGIYGFLTSAYKQTSDQLGIIDKQTEVIELKKNRFSEQLENYNDERIQLNESITELSKGLANNTIQYKDSETGNIITTTSSSTRKVLTEQLNDFKEQREVVTTKMDVLNDSITSLDLQILEITSNNELAAEIGPLRYISDISGKSMDTIVNWFALFIVLVFDPLAITLIIAFSSAVKIDREDKLIVENIYQETIYNGKDLTDNIEHETIVENVTVDYEKILREAIENYKKKNQHFNDDDTMDDGGIAQVENQPDIVDDNSPEDVVDEKSEQEFDKTDVEITMESNESTELPNQKLKDAYDKFQEERNNSKSNISNPKWIEYEQQGGWKNPYRDNEYFYHPWFDWNKADRWIYNKHAVDYWIKHKAGTLSQLQKYKDMYPDPDNTKIYT